MFSSRGHSSADDVSSRLHQGDHPVPGGTGQGFYRRNQVSTSSSSVIAAHMYTTLYYRSGVYSRQYCTISTSPCFVVFPPGRTMSRQSVSLQQSWSLRSESTIQTWRSLMSLTKGKLLVRKINYIVPLIFVLTTL